MVAYSQPQKNTARNLVISNAVQTLTDGRSAATLARRSYVRDARDHLVARGDSRDSPIANLLTDQTIGRWEAFYDSIVEDRSARSLKVAYLSGPNPENDLRAFCKAGVLPENIWAFESENATYNDAVISALSSEFPFIKLLNGGIDKFLKASPQKFDLIYLDFCGPLPSRNKKQKTLRVLTEIFASHAINSPGVLITNFSLPEKCQDEAGRSLIAQLVASYLYPKAFLEANGRNDTATEGAISHGYDHEDWLLEVKENLEYYYGQFITRLLIDHAGQISVYNRFPQRNFLHSKFFKKTGDTLVKNIRMWFFHFDESVLYGGGDVISDPDMQSVLWSLAALDKNLNANDPNYPQFIYEDHKFAKFAEDFLRELEINGSESDLIDSVALISYLLSEGAGQEDYWSDEIHSLYEKFDFGFFHQFCDVVFFHQIFELLFRQVAVPYHVNIEKTKRWRYTAKKTPMFMDMVVLDECRYLYDWMPTTDMFFNAAADIERQLSFRFALDAVAKHMRWFSYETFFGAASIDQFTPRFTAKNLEPRDLIE